MALTEEDPAAAPAEQETAVAERAPVTGHIAMVDRVPLVPWGSTSSGPSLPSADDEEVPDDATDLDGDSIRSSTMSVRSSLYNYVQENGRTYHRYKEGKYMLPNDQQEQDRLDLQHALFIITTHGKLFLAPLKNPKSVLDIATGTGIWAIEMAQLFPDAEVVGTDLSPIQPEFLPKNCTFEIDDAEDTWTFNNKFDYIHGRALVSCFVDPSTIIAQAYDHLEPGGWLELQDGIFPFEYVGEKPVNSALYKWNEYVLQGAEASGRSWTNVKHYKRWMEDAGFEDVEERRFYWPLSSWAKGQYYKTISAYFQEDIHGGVEAISFRVLSRLGWSAEKIKEFLDEVRKDVRDTSIHAYLNIRFVYGRKPLAPTD